MHGRSVLKAPGLYKFHQLRSIVELRSSVNPSGDFARARYAREPPIVACARSILKSETYRAEITSLLVLLRIRAARYQFDLQLVRDREHRRTPICI